MENLSDSESEIGPEIPYNLSIISAQHTSKNEKNLEKTPKIMQKESLLSLPIANKLSLVVCKNLIVSIVSNNSEFAISSLYEQEMKFYNFNESRIHGNNNLQPYKTIPGFFKFMLAVPKLDVFDNTIDIISNSGNCDKIIDMFSYTRNTNDRLKFIFRPGDQYLSNICLTKGHTSTINNAALNSLSLITASDDGTGRLWNLDNNNPLISVFKVGFYNTNNKRTPVTTCSWLSSYHNSDDGKHNNSSIAVFGCYDGSIQLWDIKSNTYRPSVNIKSAHFNNFGISSILTNFNDNSSEIISRSCDGTIKLHDIRNISKPIKFIDNLPNDYIQTNLTKINNLIVSGVSCNNNNNMVGKLVFIDYKSFDIVHSINYPKNTSVVPVCYNSKLNQLLVGTSTGTIDIYYDESKSKKGALLLLKNKTQLKPIENEENFYYNPVIFNDEDDFNEFKNRKKSEIKHTSDVPSSSNFSKFLLQKHHSVQSTRKDWLNQDPREALLKYNTKTNSYAEDYNLNSLESSNIGNEDYTADLPSSGFGQLEYKPTNKKKRNFEGEIQTSDKYKKN